MTDNATTDSATAPQATAPGQLEAIWIKPARRVPMADRQSARVLAGEGLAENANRGGKRQITLLSADQWDEVCREIGTEVDPKSRRANLFVRGVELAETRGRTLQVGDCRILIHGETRPCRLMEDTQPGLQEALDPDWRAGAYGEALNDAEISVGDPVAWVEE